MWAWFLQLHVGRGSNGFGPNPLSWADIAAWVSLTGTVARPAEIDAIMMLDRLWMEQKAAEMAATRPKPGKPAPPRRR